MSLRRLPFFLAAAFAQAGCHTPSSVMDIGGGRYAVTATSLRCPAGAWENAVEVASDFCDSKKRKPAVESFADQPQAMGDCASSVLFRCQ
jgi:hypothetical protein